MIILQKLGHVGLGWSNENRWLNLQVSNEVELLPEK